MSLTLRIVFLLFVFLSSRPADVLAADQLTICNWPAATSTYLYKQIQVVAQVEASVDYLYLVDSSSLSGLVTGKNWR